MKSFLIQLVAIGKTTDWRSHGSVAPLYIRLASNLHEEIVHSFYSVTAAAVALRRTFEWGSVAEEIYRQASKGACTLRAK